MSRNSWWWFLSVIGLLLVGLGLTLCIDAGIDRHFDKPYILMAIAGLVSFCAGLSCMVRAQDYR